MTTELHASPPADPVSVSEAEHAAEIASIPVTYGDLIEALDSPDVEPFISIAIARSDARLIGQIVMACRKHYQEGVAHWKNEWGYEMPDIKTELLGVFERAMAARARRGL